MIHGHKISEPIDKFEVLKYTNALIKEHRSSSSTKLSELEAAKVTAKKLAQETGKKFYYEVIKRINTLLDEQ
jgi:hypothetical protein